MLIDINLPRKEDDPEYDWSKERAKDEIRTAAFLKNMVSTDRSRSVMNNMNYPGQEIAEVERDNVRAAREHNNYNE